MEWDVVSALAILIRWPTKLIFAGVVAEEDIEKGSFVVEYEFYKTYPPSERKKHDEEYATNGEGCFILEVQLPKGQWICLDATRNVDSWARFINHANGPQANLKLQVVQVEGQWRVALLAKVFIKKGSELFYDYGRQKDPPDWMKTKPIPLEPYQEPYQDNAAAQDQEVAEDGKTAEVIHTIPSTQDNPAESSTETTKAGAATSQTDLVQKHCQQCNSITTSGILCKVCGMICQTCSDQHTRMSNFANHFLITSEKLQQLIPTRSCGQCDSTSATTYCKDCQSYLCQTCILQHERMKCFLEHKLLPKTECPTCQKEKTAFEDFVICLDCINPSSVSNVTVLLGWAGGRTHSWA